MSEKLQSMNKLITTLMVLAGLSLPGWAKPLKVGAPAPDFKLQASDGKTYTLSQFKGKKAVVIAWFPKAFTKGCTIECKGLHDNAKALNQYEVALFAASVDDAKTGAKFAKSLELPYPILADPTRATAKAYGVLGLMNMAQRHTVYVSKDGKVLAVDTAVNPSTAAIDLMDNLNTLGVAKKGHKP